MDMLYSRYFLMTIESDLNVVNASSGYRYDKQRSPSRWYVFAVTRVNYNKNVYAPSGQGKFIYVDFQDLPMHCIWMNIYDWVYLLALLLANYLNILI